MDLTREEPDALRDKYEHMHSSANWDQSSTLVFREIRQTGAVSLNGDHQNVDIRINTDSSSKLLSGDGEEHEPVLTLSWDGDWDQSTCSSTCAVCVKEHHKDASAVIINKLLKDNFTTLRQFVGMLFREYRSRLMSLRTAPLRFDIVHMSFEEFEYLGTNINVLQKNFRNLFSKDMQTDFTFELRLQTDGAIGEKSTLTYPVEGDELFLQSRSRDIVEIKGCIRESAKNKGADQTENVTIPELEQLEKKLQNQQKTIHVQYHERKTQNERMIASVKLLLDHHRKMKTATQPQEVLSLENCETETKSHRDAGDGAEAQLSTGGVQITVDIPSSQVANLASGELAQSERKASDSQILAAELSVKKQINIKADSERYAKLTEDQRHKSAFKAIDTNRPLGKSTKDTSLHKSRQKTKQKVQFQEVGKSNREIKTVRDNYKESPVSKAIGMDTVLCFHTSSLSSSTYDDTRLQEMKRIAHEYIEGVEDIASMHEIEENIGIVAAGKTTWIKHQPTNDYTCVRENIDQLHQGRKASLGEVLQASLDFIKAKAQVHTVRERYEIGPRLIIISNYTNNHHVYADEMMKEKEALINVVQRLKQEPVVQEPIVWIPFGDGDRVFLHTLSTLTNGAYIESGDVKRLCKYQQVQLAAGNMLMFMKQEGGFLTGNITKDIDFLLEIYAAKLDDDDKNLVERMVKETVTRGRHSDNDDSFLHTERPRLPPFGTRVVRGEDWIWDNQDSEGPGTIIGHLDELHVVVEWDTGYAAKYRYGTHDAYDLKVVTDQPRLAVRGFNINVGCEVRRGPDWDDEHGNEDGGPGGVGVVIRSIGDGIIKVRWRRNGYIGTYKWGLESKLELSLRDPVEILEEVTQAKDSAASEPQLLSHDEENEPPKLNSNTASGLPKAEQKVTYTPSMTADDTATEQPQSKPAAKHVPTEDSAKHDATNDPLTQKDCWIWYWQDNENKWRNYCDENNQKIEKCFNRRPEGSCLIQRENQSFRVLFKEMEEKCIDDNKRRCIQRRSSTNDACGNPNGV